MIRDSNTNTFTPGVIYELRVEGIPFYVGETTDPDKRKKEHAGCANRDESRVVYDWINEFTAGNVTWDLHVVDSYGPEGPADKEDEHIMKNLMAGHELANMKKGSEAWLEVRKAAAQVMKHISADRGIKTFAQYNRYLAEQKVLAQNAKRRESQKHIAFCEDILQQVGEPSSFDASKWTRIHSTVVPEAHVDARKIVYVYSLNIGAGDMVDALMSRLRREYGPQAMPVAVGKYQLMYISRQGSVWHCSFKERK